MTEPEYVQHIRSKAEAYIAGLRLEDGVTKATMDSWYYTKMGLSPHTLVAMCDAWLAAEAIRPETEGTEAE